MDHVGLEIVAIAERFGARQAVRAVNELVCTWLIYIVLAGWCISGSMVNQLKQTGDRWYLAFNTTLETLETKGQQKSRVESANLMKGVLIILDIHSNTIFHVLLAMATVRSSQFGKWFYLPVFCSTKGLSRRRSLGHNLKLAL